MCGHKPKNSWLIHSLVLSAVWGSTSTTQAAVALQNATATFSQTSFGGDPVGQAIDGSLGDHNGWAIYEGPTDCCGALPGNTNPQIAVFETTSDISVAGGASLTFTLQQLFYIGTHNLGRFRLSATTDARSEFADGLTTGGDVTAAWTVLTPMTANSTNGQTLTILGDDSILAGGANPQTSTYTVTAFTPLAGITGFRLEILADGSFPDSGPGRNSNGNFVLTEFQVDASSLPGDYNNNGTVDAADYVLWRDGGPLANEVDTPGVVNAADYAAWRARFGNTSGSGTGSGATGSASASAVPEPASIVVLTVATACTFCARRRPRFGRRISPAMNS